MQIKKWLRTIFSKTSPKQRTFWTAGVVFICLFLSLAGGYWVKNFLNERNISTAEHSEAGEAHEAFVIQQSLVGKLGIPVGSSKKGKIYTYYTFLGRTELDANLTNHVNPRYPGIVREVYVSVGDKVTAGSKLAVIESNIGLQRYNLTSSINGEVVHRNLNVGEFTDQERLAFSVADLSSLWVNLIVKADELKYFKNGDEVTVASQTVADAVTGKVIYVAPVIDPDTRAARVILRISNELNHWRPGMFVEGYVKAGFVEVGSLVPEKAIYWDEKQAYIFVEDRDKQQYTAKYITVGKTDADSAEVLSGLEPGQRILLSLPEDSAFAATEKDDHEEHQKEEEGEDHEGHREDEHKGHSHEHGDQE